MHRKFAAKIVFLHRKTILDMETYIWQHPEWPHFIWDAERLAKPLAEVRIKQGILIGRITTLGFETELNTALDVMTDDLMKSSKIEGILLDGKSVRSSVARQLGLEREGLPPTDRYVEGIVNVMVDAVKNCNKPLSAERLFGWHAALFPHGARFKVGAWREGQETMQVVSGALGREKVYFEAPPSSEVPRLMEEFMQWANDVESIDPIIKAAIVPLWFVTIHPFTDGNGRLSRTLTDMFLTRSDSMIHRFYSMSATFCNRRSEYYDILERIQHGGMNITPWIAWFLSCMEEALQHTEQVIDKVISKAEYWENNKEIPINERQRKVLNRLLDGFEGKLTSSKWAKIVKCSSDTALRDIEDLMQKGLVVKEGTGRGTYYELKR